VGGGGCRRERAGAVCGFGGGAGAWECRLLCCRRGLLAWAAGACRAEIICRTACACPPLPGLLAASHKPPATAGASPAVPVAGSRRQAAVAAPCRRPPAWRRPHAWGRRPPAHEPTSPRAARLARLPPRGACHATLPGCAPAAAWPLPARGGHRAAGGGGGWPSPHEVHAVGEHVHLCPLHAHFVNADLGVGDTTAEPRLRVRLALTLAVAAGRPCRRSGKVAERVRPLTTAHGSPGALPAGRRRQMQARTLTAPHGAPLQFLLANKPRKRARPRRETRKCSRARQLLASTL